MARITGAQIRAARALIGWTARALAKKAIVPEHSLEWIEGDGTITGKDRATIDALQTTLEAGGIEFIGSVGVQLRRTGLAALDEAKGRARRLGKAAKNWKPMRR